MQGRKLMISATCETFDNPDSFLYGGKGKADRRVFESLTSGRFCSAR